MDGDDERHRCIDEVLEARRPGGIACRRNRVARLGREGEFERRAEVARRIAGAGVHLESEHDLAVLTDECRPGHRQDGREGHGASVLHGERCGRGRNELAERDEIAFRRKTLERTRRPSARARRLLAVAGLIAAARAAGARLAQPDDRDLCSGVDRCRRIR